MSEVIGKYCKINNCDEVAFKRKIEYVFLSNCQKKISKHLEDEFQLYLTQHITEISFNITEMIPIQIDDLMEILEQ